MGPVPGVTSILKPMAAQSGRPTARSLPLQMNSGNTTILAFSVNPTNALTISLTGCPSYPCVGAKGSRGGGDEGITQRTPKRTESHPPFLQLCWYATYHRGHQQRLVLNTNLLASGNREVHPPRGLARPLFQSHHEKRKQVKREILGVGGLGYFLLAGPPVLWKPYL